MQSSYNFFINLFTRLENFIFILYKIFKSFEKTFDKYTLKI